MTRRCAGSLWVVEWGDTYDHSLAGVRGRPADRTLMVEPDSAEPIWKKRAAWRGVAGVPGVVELVRARRRDDRRPVRALRRPGSFSGGSPAISMTAL